MVGLVAVLAVMACMVAKMFLTLQTRALEKKLTRERAVLEETKREKAKAAGKMKMLDSENRQLEAKQTRLRTHIDRYTKTLGGYADVESKKKQKALAQQELMKKANEKK